MRRIFRWLVTVAAISVPLILLAQQERMPLADLKTIEAKWPNAKKTNTGLRYIMQIEGTGETVKRGDVVEVLYVGMTLDGRVFDKEENVLAPLKFRVGRGQVIEGWEIGLQLMKRGSKMTLIIPPSLAYGTRGDVSHGINRNAVLVFEISLLNFTREPDSASEPPATKK